MIELGAIRYPLLMADITRSDGHANCGALAFFIFTLMVFPSATGGAASLPLEWKSTGVQNGVENYYALKPGHKYKSVRGLMTVDMSAEQIASKIMAAEESAEWMYKVAQVDTIEYKEREVSLFRFEWKMPWPFANREAILNQMVVRDEAAERVTILYGDYKGEIQKSGKLSRMRDFLCTWVVETLPDGTTRVDVVIDPSPSGKTPAWLVNLFFKDAAQNSMEKLRETLRSESRH